MTYRDDLTAALSRTDQLERELAETRRDAAELAAARIELAKLRDENASLRASQYQLPHAQVQRLVAGLALAGLALFYLVASWGAPYGEPPELGLMAGPLAAVGALAAGLVIGFGGPHRAAALTVLGGAGLLLLSKPWIAPVMWESEQYVPHRINSETHYYFLIPGLIALALAAMIAGTASPRQRPLPDRGASL